MSAELDEDGEGKDDENNKLFNERAYLAGRIPLVQGGDVDPRVLNSEFKYMSFSDNQWYYIIKSSSLLICI